MKTPMKALLASALIASAGWASAAEPLALTDSQMDTVAAGTYLHSGSGGSAFAYDGFAASGTTTSAVVTRHYERTTSTTVSIAAGDFARARSGGGSSIGGGAS